MPQKQRPTGAAAADATKPEADCEIPQAQTAHATFWDFVSLLPESPHMLMWVMSERGVPRRR